MLIDLHFRSTFTPGANDNVKVRPTRLSLTHPAWSPPEAYVETRRKASASTFASIDTRTPIGRLISIVPRQQVQLVSSTGFVGGDGGKGARVATR